MPGAGDIGYYTLPVIPSFRGMESQTQDALNRAFGGAGGKAGQAFNTGAKSAITNADILASSYTKLQQSHDKAADAAGRYRAEYAKWKALAADGGSEARVIVAQERAATAYRKSQAALTSYNTGITQYNSLKQHLTDPEVPGFFERLGAHLRGRSAEVKKLGGEMGELAGKVGGFEVGTASLGRFGGVLSEVTGLMGGAGGAALGLTAGIGTLGSAAYEVEKRFYELGSEFDKTFDKLRIQTGQTGSGLRDLENATMNIAKRSPEGIGEIGATVAAVSRATHLTGRDLEALSHQLGTLGRLTGQPVDARRMGQLFRGFGISDARQEQDVVDQLFSAYQRTGIGVNELVDTLVRGHAQFKDFHLDLGQSAALLATLQSGGLDSTRAVSGLNIALANFAKAGQDPAAGLAALNQQVRDLEAAGKDPEAAAAVNKIFGTRAGPSIFEQMKSGALDLTAARDAVAATGDTVAKAAADTDDFAEKWIEVKNQVKAAIEPLASAVFKFVDEDLGGMSNWVTAHQPQIIGAFTALGTQGIGVFSGLARATGTLLGGLGDVVGVLGRVVWAMDKAYAAGQRLLGRFGEADKYDQQADAALHWSDSLHHVGDDLVHAADGMDAFRTQLQSYGDRANQAAQLTTALGDAAEELQAKGKDVVIDIKDNTPEVRDALSNLHIDLVKMEGDPTHLKLFADTDEAQAKLDAWRDQTTGVPIRVPVDPVINVAALQQQFAAAMGPYRQYLTTGPTPFLPPSARPPLPGNIPTPQTPTDLGGLLGAHAAGAVYGGRRRPDAHIMEARPGFVQWAEPSTRGEAYIPFDGSGRSTALWLEAGRRMGMVAAHDTGTVTPGSPGAYTSGLGRVERAANALATTVTKATKGFDELSDSVGRVKKGDLAGSIDQLKHSVDDLKPVAQGLRTGATAANEYRQSGFGRPSIGRPSLGGMRARLRGRDYAGALERTQDLGENLDAITTDTGIYGDRLPGLDTLADATTLSGHMRDFRQHMRARHVGNAANTVAAGIPVAENLAKRAGFDISAFTGPAADLANTLATVHFGIEGASAALGALAPEAGAALAAVAGPAALVAGGAYLGKKTYDWTAEHVTANMNRLENMPFMPGLPYIPKGMPNAGAAVPGLGMRSPVTPQELYVYGPGQSVPLTVPMPGHAAPPAGTSTPGGGSHFFGSPSYYDDPYFKRPDAGLGAGLGAVGWRAATPTTQPNGPAPATTSPRRPDPLTDLYTHGPHQWGGPISGPGPRGVDSQLIVAAPGEHMWPVPEVDAVGGHAGMYKLRAMARAGMFQGLEGGGEVQRTPRGQLLSNLYRYVNSMNGTPYSNGSRTDCSGMAARIANVALGLPPVPSFTTQNEGSWLVSHGFQLGAGPPGTLRIGWYNHGSGVMDGHTAVTLPDGVNAESGGAHGNFLVGAAAAGADNPEFDQRAWLPMNPQGDTIVSSGGGGLTGGGGMGLSGMYGMGGGARGGGSAGAGGGGMFGMGAGGGGGGMGGGGGGLGPPDLGQLGQIGSQFMKDTFGFGDLLPDPSRLPPVQFLMGFLNSFLGGGAGGGGGSFGVLGGLLGSHAGGGGAAGGMVGVGPRQVDAGPDVGIPGMPAAGGAADDAAAQPNTAPQLAGIAPINITVHGKNDTEIVNKVRQEAQWAPRTLTYTAPSATGGGG